MAEIMEMNQTAEEIQPTFENENNEETQVSETNVKGGLAHKIKTGLKFAGAAVGTAVAVKIAQPAIESFVDNIREIKDPNRKTAEQKRLERQKAKAEKRLNARQEKLKKIEDQLKKFEKPVNPNPDKQDDNPNPEPTPEENK